MRSGLAGPKQYQRVGGKPVIAHAIDALAGCPRIGGIVPVIHADDRSAFEAAIGSRQTEHPVIGGATRQASVRAGLEAIAGAGGAKYVLIHDAARPFLPGHVVTLLLTALHEAPGAIPALPIVDTLVRDGAQLDRRGVARVQTPQAFHFDAILAAHRAWPGGEPTDDAEVARAAGLVVAEVAGDENLRKLTMPDDFTWAERHLRAAMTPRTGMGFDVHGFGPGNTVWLGGIEIAHDRGLTGHSDADVALHALVDALLGAIAEGDIGTHFPPSDPRWKGAPSRLFVEHARALVERRGGIIDHIDLTIICEEPKVGPHRAAIRTAIGAMLRLDESRISIKATTTEQLGFTGRREGIAAQAVATVRLPDE